jgi:hypothetical protein
LRIRIAGATLGAVVSSLRAIVIGCLLLAAGPAAAQGVPGGRPPDAIDRARGLATQPFSTLPVPERPAVNGQRVEVPPLVVTTPDGRAVVVPGGERSPSAP